MHTSLLKTSLLLLTFMILGCTEKPKPEPKPTPKEISFPKKWETHLPVLSVASSSKYPYARAIIHLHNTYSHDACDGKPTIDGKKNKVCFQRLREALCQQHIDIAFLTEHKTRMADGDKIQEMLLYQKGDKKIQEEGQIVGNNIQCKNGHQVVILPGAENDLMPIGLKRHPTKLQGKSLNQTYGAKSPEAIKTFKKAGAFVLIAHTESKELDYLRSHDLHGLEVFNLHAIIDPRKRRDHLDLPPEQAVGEFLPYASRKLSMPHPDLAFLGFHQILTKVMAKWDQVLAHKMIYGYGGTDAHENVLKVLLRDGQRGDSYKRMIRWFSNHLRVNKKTPNAYRKAIEKGNSIVVFEVLGTPTAFDFFAESSDGKRFEVGAQKLRNIKRIHVKAEHPYLRGEEAVTSQIKLFRIEASTQKQAKPAKLIREAKGTLTFENPPPGIYRVEVYITPKHLKYVINEETEHYIHSFPWIISNPIQIIK